MGPAGKRHRQTASRPRTGHGRDRAWAFGLSAALHLLAATLLWASGPFTPPPVVEARKPVEVIEVDFVQVPAPKPAKAAAPAPAVQARQEPQPDAPDRPRARPRPQVAANPRPAAPRQARPEPQPRPLRQPRQVTPVQQAPMISAAELARRAAAERSRRQPVDEAARLAALRAGATAPEADPAAARRGGQISMSQAAPIGDLAGRGILVAPRPIYPRQAEQNYLVGTIRIRVTVGANGQVLDADVVESSGIISLDTAAKRAARGYRFSPRPDGDDTVESGVIPFHFNID